MRSPALPPVVASLSILLALAPLASGCRRSQPLAGVVVWGHEVREFRACGSQESLWVDDRSGQLWARYREIAAESPPYTEVQALVIGQRIDAPGSGFGADYPGALRITEVVELRLSDSFCEP